MAMREMQNFEYSYMAKELSSLAGKHFSKAYKTGENSYRLKIGDSHVIIDLPFRISVAKYIAEAEGRDRFAESLKKTLDNQRLLRAYQCGRDRILAFDFEKNVLFCEMFSKGNIIIADKEGRIADVLREEKWRDRVLAKGEEYRGPQSTAAESVREALSEKLKAEERENREKGDFIYSNYALVESILEKARQAGINKAAEALREYKVIGIDREKKEVELEL